MIQIELGPGTKPHPDTTIGLDLRHPWGAPPQDVAHTPWVRWSPNSSVRHSRQFIEPGCADRVYASHVLEHVPSGAPRIAVFNEAWRVLKPGGKFTIVVPLVGHCSAGWGESVLTASYEPWADPTHVSFWYFPQSLFYFDPSTGIGADADYGIKPWRVEDWSVMGGWEGHAVLSKVTP